MLEISSAFQDHLEQDITELCWVWILTRADGVKLGFTDHDKAIEFQGVVCSPSGGFTSGETDMDKGLSPDTGAVTGLFQSDHIRVADIQAGAYAGASLNTYRVVWRDPNIFTHMSNGFLGEIEQRGESFVCEWRGQASRLDRSTGRVFSRLCDAEFGDRRCGLNASNFPEGTRCPRTLNACRDQFSNTKNFRGFPYLLGDDALTAALQDGDIRDGGSRYS